MVFHTENKSAFTPAPIPTGVFDLDGEPHMLDATGKKVPLRLIKEQHKLEDEVVRKIMGFAIAMSGQVSRFLAHTLEDAYSFVSCLNLQYGVKKGGQKGNITLTTHDGLYQVRIQNAERIDFGPELQVAKALVDECLTEWAASARPELKAIVERAFSTDKPGQINRNEIFGLLRLEIEDERWKSAMQAVREAMKVTGSKTYVRFYQRPNCEAAWEPVTIDLAKG